MKNKRITTALIAGLLFCSAALYAAESAADGKLTVTVTPGTYWKTERGPQFAVWVEKADGTYITTLYVTQRAAKKNWMFAPKDGRPESLPVWYHTVNNSSVVMNAQQTADTDALTSATPGVSDVIKKTTVLPSGPKYIIKVEVNHSFDYNESWPKNAKKGSAQYSGVNGQPSVVYVGTLDTTIPGTSQGMVKLVPAGTGSATGQDGNLHNDLAGLTTALQIVDKVEASWSGAK